MTKIIDITPQGIMEKRDRLEAANTRMMAFIEKKQYSREEAAWFKLNAISVAGQLFMGAEAMPGTINLKGLESTILKIKEDVESGSIRGITPAGAIMLSIAAWMELIPASQPVLYGEREAMLPDIFRTVLDVK